MANVITSEHEALEVARESSVKFAIDASVRDAERRLPLSELEHLSSTGLLGITVPRAYGGADVSITVLTEIFRLLAVGDPNIAQIPQSHFAYVNVLRHNGTDEQRRLLYGEILNGKRFGNAQSELGTKTVAEIRTTLVNNGDGTYTLSGVKHYSTGALFAHWIPVLAKGDDGKNYVAYVKADTSGVTVIDDWEGMGQRTTASGQVRLENVRVSADLIVPHHLTFTGPQLYGAVAQILHAAIDVGIARAALSDGTAFVRERSRPWWEAGVERASEDQLTIQQVGELEIQVRGAEALLGVAARSVDEASHSLSDASAANASIAVATAKTVGARSAVDVSNALFELAGTRSSLESDNLNRHWRNARTHSLHDPVRWKVQHIGRYALNGTLPPRHGQL
jgi:SfnB family sulfur acquisition oxidoreductase